MQLIVTLHLFLPVLYFLKLKFQVSSHLLWITAHFVSDLARNPKDIGPNYSYNMNKHCHKSKISCALVKTWMGIHPVLSASPLSSWRELGSLVTTHPHTHTHTHTQGRQNGRSPVLLLSLHKILQWLVCILKEYIALVIEKIILI